MLFTDYFSEVLVIGRGQRGECPALRELAPLGIHTQWANALDDRQALSALTQSALTAQYRGAQGVLLLCADLPGTSMLPRHDDALLERLEAGGWDLLYLVHGEGRMARVEAGQRPTWLHCDAPPCGLRAVALSNSLVRRLQDSPLDLGEDTRLSPSQWLGLLAWRAMRACRSAGALTLWPSALVQEARCGVPA